jgi:hypothetical protein
VSRLGIGLALLLVAGVIALMALGFLSWALMEWLTGSIHSRPVAAAIVGLIHLLVVGGLAWQTRRLLK